MVSPQKNRSSLPKRYILIEATRTEGGEMIDVQMERLGMDYVTAAEAAAHAAATYAQLAGVSLTDALLLIIGQVGGVYSLQQDMDGGDGDAQ